MGFLDVLSKLFGNKSQRDLKEITPWVERIKAVYPEIDALSNDELRERTAQLRQRIQEYVAKEREEVASLRASVEGKDLDEREAIWGKVDKIEKEILERPSLSSRVRLVASPRTQRYVSMLPTSTETSASTTTLYVSMGIPQSIRTTG